MKVLILSCNTGGGHNSCSKALQDTLEKQKIECQVVDSLSFISKTVSSLISKVHVLVYRRSPKLFDWAYGFVERHPGIYRKGSLGYRFFSLGAKRLAGFINSENFDTVICVHVFPTVQITEARKYCTHTVHTSFVATDYTCSPVAEAGDLELYFIPDGRLISEFAQKGVDKQRLRVSGIPVHPDFFSDAHEGLQSNDNDFNKLLVMCGSMGCGPVREIVRGIADEVGAYTEIKIVCGTNKKLYGKLLEEYHSDERVQVMGYTDKISELMDEADVYLTKPGGISVSEARAKGLPMVYMNTVGGCEKYNADFFEKIGGARSCNTVGEAVEACVALLTDAQKRDEMRNALKKNVSVIPTDYIVELLKQEAVGENDEASEKIK